MTSMPASRSARATVTAPNSCPSKPGLAMRTRILAADIGLPPRQFRCSNRGLDYGRRLELAKDALQRPSDLAKRGIGLRRLDEQRHQVVGAAGRLPQTPQTGPHL